MENTYTQSSLQSLSDTQIARSLDLRILNLNTTQGSYQFPRELQQSNQSSHAKSTGWRTLEYFAFITTIHIHPHCLLATTTLSYKEGSQACQHKHIPISRLQVRSRNSNPGYLEHYLGPFHLYACVANLFQLCSIFCDPMDCSLPGSSVHGIFQGRIMEWVAISFCRLSSQPRDQTHSSMSPALAGGFLTTSAS